MQTPNIDDRVKDRNLSNTATLGSAKQRIIATRHLKSNQEIEHYDMPFIINKENLLYDILFIMNNIESVNCAMLFIIN